MLWDPHIIFNKFGYGTHTQYYKYLNKFGYHTYIFYFFDTNQPEENN